MSKILTVCLSILFSVQLFAQEKVTKAYSLKQAVDYALDNNHDVKNAKLDMVKAKAFNWEILTQGLPQLNGSVDYSHYFKIPKVPAISGLFSDPNNPLFGAINGLTTATDPKVQAFGKAFGGLSSGFSNVSFYLPENLSAGFTLSQLIFDARYMFGIQARKDLYKSSRLSRERTDIEIKYAVTKAYYQAEAAQESKSLLQDNMKLIDKLLSDTKAVFAQGLTEELDVNRLELAQTTLQSQINLQNQLAEVGLANLKFQMGAPLGDDIVLTDKLDALKASLVVSAENKFDAKNRVEYDLLNTGIILQGFNVAQKRSGYYPSLGGFLNYNWSVQSQHFGDMFKKQTQYNSDGTTSQVTPWYPTGIVGLSLKIPVFDSGLKMAQVKQAKVDQLKLINDFENFKNGAQLQFQVAQSSYNTALADEVNSQKTLDLSQKIFNKNQIKFKSGVGSSFELQQSEQEYTTNQLKHMQSIMNLLGAKSDLDKAMGVK